MNSVVNGCTSFPTPCSNTYWVQGIVGIDRTCSGCPPTSGWHVHDSHIEYVWGLANGNCGYEGNCQSICSLMIPQYININQTNYNVLVQITIDPTYPLVPLTLGLSVSNQNTGQVFYSVSAGCRQPSGANAVYYFTQLEGVLAGCGPCGPIQTFTPANKNLFFGYIDMLSSFNEMSSTNLQTQTAEGSNLYQQPLSCYGTTYNGYYLYTVQSNENTYSSAGYC